MTTVAVTNKAQGLRSFRNIDGRHLTLSPGETKTIDMHPHHVFVLEREAQAEDANIELQMSTDERDEYNALLGLIKKDNAGAVRIARTQALPVLERLPVRDKRFIQDPRTVELELNEPLRDPGDKGERQYTIRPKAKAADTKNDTPPIKVESAVVPPPAKKKVPERVAPKK